MTQRPLLIATTNNGKFKEIQTIFAPLSFNIIGLHELDHIPPEPEEYGKTIEENALIKAKYYGEATKMLTLADDAGMFIETLDGWPGINSARIAPTPEERINLVLKKLQDTTTRAAAFRVCSALYDPKDNSTHITTGTMPFIVAQQPATKNIQTGWGYTPIMYLPEVEKTYAELTIKETHEFSHRYKAIRSMAYYLESAYSHKNIVVGFALVIQHGKLLMQRRHDPGNTRAHGKWEFPGGGIDFGETMHQNIIRETKEECGLDVQVEKLLQYIHIESNQGRNRPYQIILLPHVCSVIGGTVQPCDVEVQEVQWFELDNILDQDLVADNISMMERLLPELKSYLKTNPL